MAVLEGHVVTDRPERYIKQLCQHAAALGRRGPHQLTAHGSEMEALREVTVGASWTDSAGSIDLVPWGRCELQSVDGGFGISIEADSTEHLDRIADRIERNIARIGKGSLSIHWAADRVAPPGRHTHLLTAFGLLAVASVVVVHLGIGALLIDRWRWTAGAVALVVTVKLFLVFVVGRRLHGGRPGV
jgi:hypothetical protein